MYSRVEWLKAVQLYIDYGKDTEAVINELGYPSERNLRRWYKRYMKELDTAIEYSNKHYSAKERETAVDHYLKNGRSLAETIRILGYPSYELLSQWIDVYAPNAKKQRLDKKVRLSEEFTTRPRRKPYQRVEYSIEQKVDAVVACVRGDKSMNLIAMENDVHKQTIYGWKNALLGEEPYDMNTKSPEEELKRQLVEANKELEAKKKEIREAEKNLKDIKLEVAVLEKAREIIKKDPGINLKNLTNKEKAILIDALKDEHSLPTLLELMRLARSSYYYQHDALQKPDKYTDVRNAVKQSFEENKERYGYRRIHAEITREGKVVSEKIVRKIMKQEELIARGKRKRKYNSYESEKKPSVKNLLERNFHADSPNEKWLTDITEFSIPAGKVYLSPIVDCFDGLIPSWTASTHPDAELVNNMLDKAIATLNESDAPTVHSDRGGHYRWPGWISRMDDAKLTRSMSKKGCSPDNAACEGFFGRLKNEMFYDQSWEGVSVEEFIDILNEYIVWYNEKRIKLSLGAMSPMEYRRSLGIVA